MSYPLRNEFHRARKAVSSGIDSLWPRVRFDDIGEAIHYETRAAYDDPGPALLPDQAREFLVGWRDVREVEAVYRIRKPCTIDPKMGILFVDGRIAWGSSDLPSRERNPRFLSHIGKPARTLPAAILLHHFHGDNYFHFFLYVLNKACVADTLKLPEEIPFLVPEKTAATPFFKQAQQLGVFGARKVIVQGRKQTFQVAEAYVVRAYFCFKDYLDWICDRLGVPQAAPDGAPLFVARNRSAANGRLFRNQPDIDALARQRGFDVVDPGTLSLAGQVDVFSKAPVIAGAHGAGMTNLIFRRSPPCRIIELFNPGMGSPHYYMLAREKGFAYRNMITRDPVGRSFTASTEVDLEQLAALIDDD